VRSLKARVGDIIETWDRFPTGMTVYKTLSEHNVPTLSALMEREDESDYVERGRGEDAFTRALAYCDIRTASDRYGSYYASPVSAFNEGDNQRAKQQLFPEWSRRVWRSGTSVEQRIRERDQAENQRAAAMFLSTDFAVGTIQRPYDDDNTLRMQQVQPALPLTEVVSRTRGNNGNDYRSRYLVEPTAASIRMLRVTEAAEIPRAYLSEGSHTIRLHKFGRALEASYEALRNTPLDDLTLYIRKLALQTEVDQVSAALDVYINGDGNSGTSATSVNLTTLDPATTANNLTLLAWLNFILQWVQPYQMTHIIGTQAAILKLLTLPLASNSMLATQQGLAGTPVQQSLDAINRRLTNGIRWGISADIPSGKLLGFDSRFGVEHVVENNSDISESERWITRQTEVLTFSFNENFAVPDQRAAVLMNLAA
jgi:hypothetical protein